MTLIQERQVNTHLDNLIHRAANMYGKIVLKKNGMQYRIDHSPMAQLGDKLLTKIKSETRGINSKKKFLEESILDLENELLDFALLADMEKELKPLEELTEKIKTDKASLISIRSYKKN